MKIFPENASSYGHEVDFIFWLITSVVAVASLIVIVLILYPLLTRKRNYSKEQRYFKGENSKQLRWVILGVVLLAIADFSFLAKEGSTWTKIEETLPPQDLHIAVVGRQWMWEFIYPGPDGKLHTADDVKQFNRMVIPVNATVHMDIQSYDVIHSVFIPNARFKQDALPGRSITRWIKMTKEGKYPLSCAEICGIGHSNMKAVVEVVSAEKFKEITNKWYKR